LFFGIYLDKSKIYISRLGWYFLPSNLFIEYRDLFLEWPSQSCINKIKEFHWLNHVRMTTASSVCVGVQTAEMP